jgi:hypothetical protein
MPYPQQTFNNLTDLLAYTNSNIVTNGLGEIDAVELNNVLNGLATFIQQNPLNWDKAKVESSGGIITIERGVTEIKGIAPTTVTWGDNVQNEFKIVNMTASNIPLASGKSYYDVNANQITYIPSRQVLNICKDDNNKWIQVNNFSSNGGSDYFGKEYINVGNDSPQIMVNGDTTYTITRVGIKIDSIDVTINGIRIYPDVIDELSVNIVYNSDNAVITFLNPSIDNPSINLGVENGWKIIIDYVISTI